MTSIETSLFSNQYVGDQLFPEFVAVATHPLNSTGFANARLIGEITGYHPATIRKLCANGSIDYEKIGASRLTTLKEVWHYMQEKEETRRGRPRGPQVI